MEPKPAHLGPRFGAAFEAESIARAYHTRPPYPAEFFETLVKLQPAGPRSILDLGCGTGEVALGLLGRVDRIDAVDPSEAMLRVARARVGGNHPSLSWIRASAEAFVSRGPYSLVVAAESLHWMEWEVVLPKIADALQGGAFLALALGRSLPDAPWQAELEPLIARYSTNTEYRPYDLVAELTRRGLFREAGRHTTRPVEFRQPSDDYVESFHTRSAFSRESMSRASAAEFDGALRELVSRHCPAGVVVGETVASVIWGEPSAATPG